LESYLKKAFDFLDDEVFLTKNKNAELFQIFENSPNSNVRTILQMNKKAI